MFRFIESRHGYDVYQANYNGRHYVIQFNPRLNRIEQMRPAVDGGSGIVSHLFQSYLSSLPEE
ncbi:hypothetical protein ACFPU1_10945 [Thalassorhabdus alkalitolerans]|uniref:Uncharacterized protein n=1 Tax=Thalassorhabdus alkalitolerans TaxID=2282697 RepID=A0ABW0YQ97_9BACI|nr:MULTISPECIES: hypothetical protein [Bacillaceae]